MSLAHTPADRDAPTKRALAVREGSARARRSHRSRHPVQTGACLRRARLQGGDPLCTTPNSNRQPDSPAALLAQAAAFKSP